MDEQSSQAHAITVSVTNDLWVVGSDEHIAERLAAVAEEQRQLAQAQFPNSTVRISTSELTCSPRRAIGKEVFEYVFTRINHWGEPLVHCHIRMSDGGRPIPIWDGESMGGLHWDMRIDEIMNSLGAVKDEGRDDVWELPGRTMDRWHTELRPFYDVRASRDSGWLSEAQEADMAFDDERTGWTP